MSLTDSLKKFANEALNVGKDIAEQGKVALDNVGDKSKGLLEQTKLSMDNQKQAQAILDAQAEIGKYVAENNLLGEDEFIVNQMAIIAEAQEAQEKNNARISELKAPKVKAEPEEPIVEPVEEKFVHVCTLRYCPKCGAQVRTDAKFCQACGTEL